MSKVKDKAPQQPDTTPPVTVSMGIVPKGELREIELDLIDEPAGESDRMPRPGDQEAIAETARSMREVGQLQAIMVERREHESTTRYTRVFGRRRIMAARLNNAKTILARVVDPLPPELRRTIVAVENIQRQNLSPAEEHLAVAELLELQALNAAAAVNASVPTGQDLGKSVTPDLARSIEATYTELNLLTLRNNLLANPKVRRHAAEMVAAMLAKSLTWVRDRMYIGRLDGDGRALVLAGKLPLIHAQEIARVADPKIRAELARSYAAGGECSLSDVEPGSLADLRDEVRRRIFALEIVPWKLSLRVGEFRPCEGCPHNSESSPGLFSGDKIEASKQMVGGMGVYAMPTSGPVCTLHSCYAGKLRITKDAVSAAAKRIVDQERDPKKEPGVVAAFVSDKALKDKIKQRKEYSGKPAVNEAAAPDQEKQKALKAAEEELDQARNVRTDKTVDALKKLAKADPLNCVALLVANCKYGFHRDSQGMKAVLKAVKAGFSVDTFGAYIAALAKGMNAGEAIPSRYSLGDDLQESIIKILELKDLGPLPTLADFLKQRASGQDANGAAEKPEAKPSNKTAGKKARQRA